MDASVGRWRFWTLRWRNVSADGLGARYLDELLRLASEAHLGGLMTGKAGIVHLPLGDGPRGLELVVGANRDAEWGPVVLVGLGGIWIEALKDVRLIPADMAVDDIVVELGRLKAAVVLQGIRGAAGVDLHAIAQVVAQVGAQMRANPAIAEIDINPLVAYPAGSARPVLALDALVVATAA